MAACACAQTNAVPVTSLPASPSAVDMWDLVIGIVSPFIVWGVATLMPRVPRAFLPLMAPIVGVGLSYIISWLGGLNLGWFEAAKAGALAVFFRETVNQWVTKRLVQPSPDSAQSKPSDSSATTPPTAG